MDGIQNSNFHKIIDRIKNYSILNDRERLMIQKYYDLFVEKSDHNIAINVFAKKEQVPKQKIIALISNILRKLRNDLIRNKKTNSNIDASIFEAILGEIAVFNEIILKNSNKFH